MCASPLDFLRAGPPPPRVAVLPDGMFFSRAIPVAPGSTRAEVVAQVGLALESLSPFPLAQVYFGYYWPQGADHALVFAAYRRRFTVEQVESWKGVQHVIPAFATVLGSGVPPATTVILSSPEGLTAVHWGTGPVPTVILFQPVLPDAPPEERAEARARLIRVAGEATKVIDVASAPEPQRAGSDRELAFQAGELRSALAAEDGDALDIRDKGELAALARARARDMVIWRVAIGCIILCLAMLVGEGALFGAGFWQKARLAKVAAQKPTVQHVMGEQELAGRIDDLSTKRLLPLEMISAASPEVALPKSPPAIQFLRATANTLDSVQIEAQTSNAGEIAGYKTALEQAANVERVEIRDQRARDNVVTFTLVITFKPGALAPAAS